jgi:O-antigen/teichoic acid export membrane protein
VPLAEVAVTLGFGADYAPAGRTFRILVFGLPFVYVIWVLHAVALSANHTRILLTVTAVGSCLNIGLNAIWIPQYAQDGAAAATVVSEAVATGLLIYGLRHALAGWDPARSDTPTTTT